MICWSAELTELLRYPVSAFEIFCGHDYCEAEAETTLLLPSGLVVRDSHRMKKNIHSF